jgi:hypothetical protein
MFNLRTRVASAARAASFKRASVYLTFRMHRRPRKNWAQIMAYELSEASLLSAWERQLVMKSEESEAVCYGASNSPMRGLTLRPPLGASLTHRFLQRRKNNSSCWRSSASGRSIFHLESHPRQKGQDRSKTFRKTALKRGSSRTKSMGGSERKDGRSGERSASAFSNHSSVRARSLISAKLIARW